MSKKLENISIEVNELKGKSIPSWEVIIPNKKLLVSLKKWKVVIAQLPIRAIMFFFQRV
ncbi:hypothetical protein LBJG_00623 [Lactobacillus jensenii 1153]|nr:hypothetical protein LBJG_00623 [Lactobacillus jensenii 1153]